MSEWPSPMRPAMDEPMDLIVRMAQAQTKRLHRLAEAEYRRLTGEVKLSAREIWAVRTGAPRPEEGQVDA